MFDNAMVDIKPARKTVLQGMHHGQERLGLGQRGGEGGTGGGEGGGSMGF